jgi:DNA invertase Pin-like site-specific DNA recombinase
MVTAAGQGLGLAGRVTGRYTRISDDTEHAARGVGRQDQDETAYIEAAGGVVGPLYEENDTSAYQKKRIRLPDGMIVYRVLRPVWQRMLADLRAGVITAACVADLDRLARDPRDLEDAIEVVEHYRRPIVGVRGGFDLVTDNGRFAARILVAQANKSSADTAARVARKHVEQQQQGIPTGGRRPFGWKPDKRTLEPGEATELRLAVQRITAGWSVGAVVMDFNTRGVRPTRATEWVGSSLVGLLRNPRLCGLRARTVAEFDPDSGVTQHHLEIVVHPDGTPVVGQWEPLISVPEWEAVNAALASRAKTPAPRPIGHNAWKYLLSGFLRCGECGKPMRGMSNASRTAAKRYPLFVYSCQSQAAGGCGRVARHGPKTDLHVVEAVLARIELELAQATEQVGPWPGEAALAEVSADIAELTAAWKATPKRISSARYFALLPDLEAAERRLLAERCKHGLAAEVALHRPADIRGEWPDYPLSRKRSIIEGELRAVIVYKATRRGAPFDPDRLELVWKTD